MKILKTIHDVDLEIHVIATTKVDEDGDRVVTYIHNLHLVFTTGLLYLIDMVGRSKKFEVVKAHHLTYEQALTTRHKVLELLDIPDWVSKWLLVPVENLASYNSNADNKQYVEDICECIDNYIDSQAAKDPEDQQRIV